MVIHNMGNFAVTWIAKDYLLAADTEAAVLKAAAYARTLPQPPIRHNLQSGWIFIV